MPLSTKFTDGEVEYIREICRLPNTEDRIAILVSRIDSLNASQVIATQRDIDQWTQIEYGTEKSKGGIKGTDYDSVRNRDYITNKTRDRLAYPPLPSTSNPDDLGIFSISIPGFSSTSDEFSQ